MLLLHLLACLGNDADELTGDIQGTLPPASAPEAPHEAGLVLGLRDRDGSLRTLFVDRDGATELGEGLAVPRTEGWWTVRLEGRTDGGFTESWLAAAPVGAEPPPYPSQEMENCEGGDALTVLFVGPDHLSVELSSGGYCEGTAHPFASKALRTVSLDGLPEIVNGGVPIDSALGAGEIGECLEPANLSNWGLIRSRGAWSPRGGLSHGFGACRGHLEVFTVQAEVPPALTGPDVLGRAWSEISAASPDTLDALAAPDGSFEVLLSGEGLRVQVEGETVAEHTAAGAAIVLAQWALGAEHVERWRREAAAAL